MPNETFTPAGWYPDGQGQLRWWDGQAWTSFTSPLPQQRMGPAPQPRGTNKVLLGFSLALGWAPLALAVVIFCIGDQALPYTYNSSTENMGQLGAVLLLLLLGSVSLIPAMMSTAAAILSRKYGLKWLAIAAIVLGGLTAAALVMFLIVGLNSPH
ncbi:MAG: DUF2510 domain-containing protein [Pseudoclavibacter sp.]